MPLVISGTQGISSNGVTWTATPSAANTVVNPYVPAFSASGTMGSAQGSGQVAPFNYVTLNQGSNYSTSTYRFTAPVAGTYFFSVHGLLGPNASGQALTAIRKNGAIVAKLHRNDTPATSWEHAFGACTMVLAVNDYVDVYISDGSLYLDNANFYTKFNGFLLG